MITALKNKLIEADHPVGRKPVNNWKLPPSNFSYGWKEKDDEFHAGAITGGWQTHKESTSKYPPSQDFVKINKLAISNRAYNFGLNKEFRKTADVKQRIKKGTKSKKIYLPDDEFVYGKRNRTPTPIKEVICYDYAKKGEDTMRKTYSSFIGMTLNKPKLLPILTNSFKNKIYRAQEERYHVPEKENLYKMKLFSNIDSKVRNRLNMERENNKLKTANQLTRVKNDINNKDDGIDNLIRKVEREVYEMN